MKVVASFSTPAEAHLALTRLTSAQIEAVIRDELTVTLNWLWSNAVGGVKIEVVEEDIPAALLILAQPPVEEGLINCPFCGSSETGIRVLSVFSAVCLMLKLPIPATRVIVDCHRCHKTHDIARNGSPPA